LAFCLFESVEPVHKACIGRQDIFMRDYIGEIAAISEDANQEIVLASFSAGEQAFAT
jgi:hypothetical protein